MVSYLKGETNTCKSIDKSAPIELPKTVQQNSVSSSSSNISNRSSNYYGGPNSFFNRDDDGQAPRKMAKTDEMETNRIAILNAKLDGNANRIQGFTVHEVMGIQRPKAGGEEVEITEALGSAKLSDIIVRLSYFFYLSFLKHLSLHILGKT